MSSRRGKFRIGLMVPFTNTNLEPDFALMCPPEFMVHTVRMGGYEEEAIPGADQMRGLGTSGLDEPLRLLNGAHPDVIVYGCTSATLTHGPSFDQSLSEKMSAMSGCEAITAAGALVEGLRRTGVDRIGFASPYVAEINSLAVSYLEKSGFQVVSRAEVDSALSNEGQGAMTPSEVFNLGLAADRDDIGAIVLSCTDMRSVEIIDALEKETGKPVITSNQALLAAVIRAVSWKGQLHGFGRLLSTSTK
ncbi:Asp/Glu racemase [uncultured Roseobacter sp.]|uniref:maleate cis-trans isomerase family protein n=1 Tax=uncultured Roseobacter sp. TaxID=114847 RepID=UPI002601D05B|nr:Asp/Glu racemase [uncultured Roseobacter sp.]